MCAGVGGKASLIMGYLALQRCKTSEAARENSHTDIRLWWGPEGEDTTIKPGRSLSTFPGGPVVRLPSLAQEDSTGCLCTTATKAGRSRAVVG